MIIPVIALVGRTNVGKSTLFNRLTRTNDALVDNVPGLTLDRKYGKAYFAEQEFILIDTGNINSLEKGIGRETAYQTSIAIREADIILFIVDIRSGLMPSDYLIINYLRTKTEDKKIYLIVNKIDGLDYHNLLFEFYVLGIKEIYPIAALYGRGINKLIARIILYTRSYLKENLVKNNNLKLENQNHNITNDLIERGNRNQKIKINDILCYNNNSTNLRSIIKLAIVGRPNVGKSTLVNRILGKRRMVVGEFPGTTRDSICIPIERGKFKYMLIDTAGIRKISKINQPIEKVMVCKTLQSIESANVVILVIDAIEGILNQDLSLLGVILNKGRSLVIVVNKWDKLMTSEDRKSLKEILNFKLSYVNFAKVHFISALYSSLNYIENIFSSVYEAYNSATRKINTALLIRIMKIAEVEHQPPIIRGRRVKLKYAHIGGYNPPTIVIHGNQVTCLPNSYKRYLMNYFRKKLNCFGTPIHIKFIECVNPYLLEV